LWGGWSHRFSAAVFDRAGWPYGVDTLAPYYDELEERLGVVEGVLDERYRELARTLDVSIVPKRGALARDGHSGSLARDRGRRAHARRRAPAYRIAGARAPSRVGSAHREDRSLRGGDRPRWPLIETARILLESSLDAARGTGRPADPHGVSYVLLELVLAVGPPVVARPRSGALGLRLTR
jgi:hypothetical protein